MASSNSGSSNALAVMSGIAGTLLGIIVGYVIAAQQPGAGSIGAGPTAPVSAPAAAPGGSPPVLVNERELDTFRQILARDPKNVKAAIELGNRLYDAGRFGEAIPYYQQAFALDPRNINVSTDLGTALWYTGRADEALQQYARSLAIDSNHGQTLFNVGVVRLDGKQDPKGAIEAWETLLKVNPGYPDAEKARRLLDQARLRVGSAPGAAGGSTRP